MRKSIDFVVVVIIGLLMLLSVIGGYVTAKYFSKKYGKNMNPHFDLRVIMVETLKTELINDIC